MFGIEMEIKARGLDKITYGEKCGGLVLSTEEIDHLKWEWRR